MPIGIPGEDTIVAAIKSVTQKLRQLSNPTSSYSRVSAGSVVDPSFESSPNSAGNGPEVIRKNLHNLKEHEMPFSDNGNLLAVWNGKRFSPVR